MKKEYPVWVCRECALKALKKEGRKPVNHLCTFHNGVCGVCGKETSVTEPRDYGYPKFGTKT